MMRKVVAALVLAGSLAAGSTVLAAPAGAAGRVGTVNCSDAATTLAHLQAAQAWVAAQLAALNTQLAQGSNSAPRWRTFELREEIAGMTALQTWLAAQVSHLQAQCPSAGAGGSGGVTIVA